MRINIPKKLEKYKDHIKKSSIQIAYSKKFVFEKIGSSKNKNDVKELYICYNPYNSNIKLNINQFNSDKGIYKMYPPSFDVPSHEIFAFMVFANSLSKLELNEEMIIYNQRNYISSMINKLDKKIQGVNKNIIIEEYSDDISSTILLDDSQIVGIKKKINNLNMEKTQHLDDLLEISKNSNIEFVNGDKEEKKGVLVKLENIENENNKKYCFHLEFINTNKENNYIFNDFSLNIYDKENKTTIDFKKKIELKKNSKKGISFLIDKSIFEDFDMNDLKIKILF